MLSTATSDSFVWWLLLLQCAAATQPGRVRPQSCLPLPAWSARLQMLLSCPCVCCGTAAAPASSVSQVWAGFKRGGVVYVWGVPVPARFSWVPALALVSSSGTTTLPCFAAKVCKSASCQRSACWCLLVQAGCTAVPGYDLAGVLQWLGAQQLLVCSAIGPTMTTTCHDCCR